MPSDSYFELQKNACSFFNSCSCSSDRTRTSAYFNLGFELFYVLPKDSVNVSCQNCSRYITCNLKYPITIYACYRKGGIQITLPTATFAGWASRRGFLSTNSTPEIYDILSIWGDICLGWLCHRSYIRLPFLMAEILMLFQSWNLNNTVW